MSLSFSTRRSGHRPNSWLCLEALESRDLLSAVPSPSLPLRLTEVEPNDTINLAQPLGDLSTTSAVQVQGAIGNSPAGAADVDWYSFTLDQPAAVTFTALNRAGTHPAVTLSLYANDPYDSGDPYSLFGYLMLEQATAPSLTKGTLMQRSLAADTYFVAVSGNGNRYFSPFVADSGYNGQTGNYQIDVTAAPLNLLPTDGPVVLASNPAPGAQLSSSPEVLRVDTSTPLDPNSVDLEDNLRLTYNPNGQFGNGNDQDIPLNTVNVTNATSELQVTPAAPLVPGYYQLWLGGNPNTNFIVLTELNGVPLGTDAAHPLGRDFVLSFQVTGVEGNKGANAIADDTPAGAHQLGNITSAGLVQVPGMIGDDPTDPVPFNPAAVDLYHFTITGPGQYAFAAEVFARRIDSPLDPGVSLFVLDPTDGQLTLVAGNDNTGNTTEASNHRSRPLFADSAIFTGLTAGDYYVAVSSHGNVPDPDLGFFPGTDGIFDPEVSHSGSVGNTIGPYVLNLKVSRDNTPPTVIAVTPSQSEALNGPPTQLTVRFSVPVNLQQLAFQAFERTAAGSLPAVYIQGADGAFYYPRLQSFDPTTDQAVFLMLDRLPPGEYELHLSGPLGVTDFAGNPLVGNSPDGDYIVHFSVVGAGVGPLPWLSQEPNSTSVSAQNLGVLFPHELEGPGVTIVRNPSALADSADSYQFTVLEDQAYFLVLTGSDLPPDLQMSVFDDSGTEVATTSAANGASLGLLLNQGTYKVELRGWSPAQALTLAYELKFDLGGSPENPQPLTLGPAPALRLLFTQNSPAADTISFPAGPTIPVGTTLPSGSRFSLLAALGAPPIGPIPAGDDGDQVPLQPTVPVAYRTATLPIQLLAANLSGGTATDGPILLAEGSLQGIAIAPTTQLATWTSTMPSIAQFIDTLWREAEVPPPQMLAQTSGTGGVTNRDRHDGQAAFSAAQASLDDSHGTAQAERGLAVGGGLAELVAVLLASQCYLRQHPASSHVGGWLRSVLNGSKRLTRKRGGDRRTTPQGIA